MFENKNQLGDITRFHKRKTVYDYKAIKLELSSICNARCIFCTMFKNPSKPQDFLSMRNALTFVDMNSIWLRKEKYYIEPFFNGESLMNPHFFEIIELLVSNNILLGDLDSNFGIEFDILRFASLPWRSVTVNIGGISPDVHYKVMGTSYDIVISNLKKLLASPKRAFLVYLKMNPVADNLHEQKDLASFTFQISPDLKWKAQQSGIPVPSDLTIDQLADAIETIYSADYDEYFRFSPDENRGISVKNHKCIYKLPCVNADGSVTICSHDQLRHLKCGNAFTTPMEQILASELYMSYMKKAAQKLFSFCEGCN